MRTDAPDQWERLNRTRIAAAYALSRRGAILGDVAGLVRIGAQIAVLATGAWLVTAHALTPAALFACLLINAALLDPLQQLVVSLPAVRSAMGAYRHLRALPAESGPAHPSRRIARAEPAAAAAAPQRARATCRRLAAVVLFAVAALGLAYAGLGDLAGLTGGAIFETRLTPLHFSKLGAGARCTFGKAPR